MRRLLQRLKTVQTAELGKYLSPKDMMGVIPPSLLNESILAAVATVLHEGGIVAAPTGDEKRQFVESYAPTGKTKVPRK